MRFRNSIIFNLVALLLTTPAIAQEGSDKPAFNGPAVVAIVGGDGRETFSDGSGAVYGGAVGYDAGSGDLRFGVEAEASGSSVKECGSFASTVANGPTRFCLRQGRDLYVGGRAGFVVGSALLYGKVGYTNARQRVTFSGGSTGNTTQAYNLDGVRAGAGVEYGAGRLIARAEYRYSNYADGYDGHQGVVGLGIRF